MRMHLERSLLVVASSILAHVAIPDAARAGGQPSDGDGKLHPVLQRRLAESGEPVKAWVFFADKGHSTADARNAAVDVVARTYNTRAVQRRSLRSDRARHGEPLFNTLDLPIAERYVAAVESTGARIDVRSRWLNAVSAHLTPGQAARIAALPFVDRLEAVRQSRRVEVLNVRDVGPGPFSSGAAGRDLDYGASLAQLSQINLIALHDAGYTGQGVVVGILDTGFQRSHDAFNWPLHPLSVIAEYDFVDDDDDTGIEPGDPFSQHNHGTMILGCLGAYAPGSLIGGAYNASFVLAKTEDITQEVPAEEDDFVAGLEFIESNGADMSTASLGYIDWYSQSQLDGQTAVTTIAMNIHTSLGVHHCNAAGNEYHDSDPATSSLIAPADAFQVITCGAVDSGGGIAFFSSDGPTADGRVKPEVLARGVSTHTVSTSSDTTYTTADGTSLSTPVVACAVACLIEARPYWTVDQMREFLFETADYYVEHETFDPLYIRGYGIVDAFGAYSHEALSILLPDGMAEFVTPGEPITIPVEIQDGSEQFVEGSAVVFYRYDGGAWQSAPLAALGGQQFQAVLPEPVCGDVPEYYFAATGSAGTTMYNPPTAPADVYSAGVAHVVELFNDDFETDQGWTTESVDLETGVWERGVPAGSGLRQDPVSDFDGSGQCFLTDNTPGNFDVDGGPTRLISPVIDLSAAHEPVLEYARWWGNDDQDGDPFVVELSDDGGTTWALVEQVADVPNGWVPRTIAIRDHVSLTAQVQLRFSAMDNPNNSIDEAGVDAIRIRDIWCSPGSTGDVNCDGGIDFDDIDPFVAAMSCTGGSPDCWPPEYLPADCPWLNADCNGDNDVTFADIDAFVALIGSGSR